MERWIKYALSKPGSYEDYPFGQQPTVMKVGSKMFALISTQDNLDSISLKCDPFIADLLRAEFTAVKPGYHLNKRHWNTVTIDGSISQSEVETMIDNSYELVFKSLSKSEKNKILNRIE